MRKETATTDRIIGTAYTEVKRKVIQFAKQGYPVLLYGETGTGKEEFAKLYMNNKPEARTGNLATVNCAAFSDGLLRSELFGHTKGAFTGANNDRVGLIRTCDKGIVFLDELGSAVKEFQAAILRVVEENKVRPLGSDIEKSADVLIIAATNNLSNIRQDLQFRFHIIHIPPMQKSDIPALVRHFAGGKSIKKEFLDNLMSRPYPGNVRELKKQVEKLQVEKGEEFYSHKEAIAAGPGSVFDYDRYCRELDTWNTRIKPILDKLVHNLRYSYQPWDDNWVDEKSPDRNLSMLSAIRTMSKSCEIYDTWELSDHGRNTPNFILYSRTTLELFDIIKRDVDLDIVLEEEDEHTSCEDSCDIKSIPGIFKHHLQWYISVGALPFLLKIVEAYPDKGDKPKEIGQPPLSHLLKMPIAAALAQFEGIYWDHFRQTYGSLSTMAEKAGMTAKLCEQRIRRNKKNRASEEGAGLIQT